MCESAQQCLAPSSCQNLIISLSLLSCVCLLWGHSCPWPLVSCTSNWMSCWWVRIPPFSPHPLPQTTVHSLREPGSQWIKSEVWVERHIWVWVSFPSHFEKDDSPREKGVLVEANLLSSSCKSRHYFLVLKPCPPQLPVLIHCSVKDLSAPRTAAAILKRTWPAQRKLTSRSRATLSVNPSIWLCPTVRSWEGLTSAGLLFLPFPKPVLSAWQPIRKVFPGNWDLMGWDIVAPSPLSMGDMFQNPQWMPRTEDSTKA